MSLDDRANQCFVCGPGNSIGLKVKFRLEEGKGDDEDVCRAEFTPQPKHMGYDSVTHGGIIFSLLDDVMANWLWLKGEKSFTARAEIRYRSALEVGTPIRLEGRLRKRKGRLVVLAGQLIRQQDDFVVAETTGHFMLALDQ